ncbi:hypothetical protein PAN31108_04762 [Pandoraea anhela]|uniref:Uncharacterized protein n=1 Tax=Pandoraea anhela TaxID=2508295 RepID=A0A5E4YV07_9BURK|nr:hypothetical protein PAN31108_04762 [Pandoraea anhela]
MRVVGCPWRRLWMGMDAALTGKGEIHANAWPRRQAMPKRVRVCEGFIHSADMGFRAAAARQGALPCGGGRWGGGGMWGDIAGYGEKAGSKGLSGSAYRRFRWQFRSSNLPFLAMVPTRCDPYTGSIDMA